MMAPVTRIGVQLNPTGVPDYSTWRAAVQRAEDLGADIIFTCDHLLPTRGECPVANSTCDVTRELTNFEGWMAIAAWSEFTSCVEVGLLVTGIGYRNPNLLADMARTVDHISAGRLILGVGAGSFEREHQAYGYEFGTVASRMDQLDEALLQIKNRLRQLTPAPVRRIPILIGGAGPERTLPTVARHADIWHCRLAIDDYREATVRVRELAAAFGRSDDDIERAVSWEGELSAEEYLAEGAAMFVVELCSGPGGYDFSPLEQALRWRDPPLF